MNVMLAYKALAAVLAVAVAVAGLGGGVALAADALPGEPLYQVKLLSEDVRLALTADPSARAEMEMAFVALRVQEMARLALRGEDVPQAVVARMTRQMEQVMMEIAKARPEEAPALLERVMDRTRLHQQVLEDAASGVSMETQTRLREASQLMERTRLNAENDPNYLEYQHQNRYQGEQSGQGEGQQAQEQNQEQNREQNQDQSEGQSPDPSQEQSQDQNQEQNREQNQGQSQEQDPDPNQEQSQDPNQEQNQDQNQEQNQGQNQDPNQEQNQDRNQEQNQNSYEGEQSPTSGGEPQPTRTQQGGNSGNGH